MALKISNEVKIGSIVVAGIVILVWGLGFLKGNGVFSTSKTFYVKYGRVDGLVSSNAVQVNGLKVGQVDEIKLLPGNSGQIEVSLLVDRNVRVTKNTIARIVSADFLGAKVIELNFGNDTIEADDGDTLRSEIQIGISEEVNKAVAPLKVKVENLLASMDSVLGVVQYVFNQETRDDLAKSLKNINSTIKTIEHTTFTFDKMLSTEQNRLKNIFSNIESISLNLKNNNEQVTKILANFSSISDSLAKSNLASTIESARTVLSKASSVLDQINKGEGSIGLLLHNDSLYNSLASSAENLDKLMIDIKANPKRYIQFSVFSVGSGKAKAEKPQKKNIVKQ